MDLIELNYNDEEELDQEQACSIETSVDHSTIADDIYEDPIVPPRLGDMYQAEIPPLMKGSEHLQLSCTRVKNSNIVSSGYSIAIGLAIPVAWSDSAQEHIKREQENFPGIDLCTNMSGSVDYRKCGEGLIHSKSNKVISFTPDYSNMHAALSHMTSIKSEHLEYILDCNKESARCMRQENGIIEGHMDVNVSLQQTVKVKSCSALPGLLSASWTFADSQSFLLGLYIFGKNLVQIRKFMRSKHVGDILSFYYGNFYRSDAHRRWKECRKIRRRRFIHGPRIFTGWRQQELLSRLLPGLSKDVHDALFEAVKAFNEGRASLEEFVLSLEAMVGMEVLVEAVGIGQGKRDLTGIVLDPIRTNQVISVRPDIPTGKACSSLTAGDITKFLTGNFRLSKAKSNDLFWEAVWPRLLARGWHSEQPKDKASFASKNALVFLVPGIKKFTRRKLTKGNHYFDSISDVLNKVASDPSLMELDTEGSKESCSIRDEYGQAMGAQLKRKSSSEHQQSCYLRPRVTGCNSEIMKFTIVDTSLYQGEVPRKVRELRSLPLDSTYHCSFQNVSGETDSDSSSDQPDSFDISSADQEESNSGASETKKLEISTLGDGMLQADVSEHLSSRFPVNGLDLNIQQHDLWNGEEPFNDMRGQSSWPHDYFAPVVKRRRLTACKHAGSKQNSYSVPQSYHVMKEEISSELKPIKANENIPGGNSDSTGGYSFYSFSVEHHSKKEVTPCGMNPLKRTKAMGTEANASRRKLSGSSVKESRDLFSATSFGRTAAICKTVLSQEMSQPQTLIDLNVPYFQPDVKNEEPSSMDVACRQDDLNLGKFSLPSEMQQQLHGPRVSNLSHGLPKMSCSTESSRRQSTRSRPLTTKALEALACGFLSSSQKGRGSKAVSSRSSRPRPHRTVRTPSPTPTDLVFSETNGLVSNVGMNDECKLYTNGTSIISKHHDQSKEKEAHDLLGVP